MAGLVSLAAGAVVLAAVTAATARPPGQRVPGVGDYLDRWGRLHGGYDPRAGMWVGGWLRLVYVVARPLAAVGAHPDVLTLWGALVSAAAVVAADAGGRWLLLAGLLVICSGLADSLDGAVAVLTDRVTAWGYVWDSVVDRASDVLFLFALVAAGAPGPLALAAAAGLWWLEYLRARAAGAGLRDITVVTVGERGVRIAVCAATLLCAGLVPSIAAGTVTLGTLVLAALTAAGFLQLGVAVRRELTRSSRSP